MFCLGRWFGRLVCELFNDVDGVTYSIHQHEVSQFVRVRGDS